MSKCKHGPTSKERCFVCASPKYGEHKKDGGMSDLVERLRKLPPHSGPCPLDLVDASLTAADTIERMQASSAEYKAEVEVLRKHLRFVERWANHHAQKPRITPQEALSVIQHYPPIKEITQSYTDGVVPETPNPWLEVEAFRNDAGRYRKLVASEKFCASNRGVGWGLVYGVGCADKAELDAAVDAMPDIDAALRGKEPTP